MVERLFGSALDLSAGAISVRVRSGTTQIESQRPIPGTDAFLADLDVIECADLEAGLGGAARSRPADGQRADRRSAHLLLGWLGGEPSVDPADRGLITAIEAWRSDVDVDYLMGSSFGAVVPVAELRLRTPRAMDADTPFITIAGETASLEVISATRRETIALAAGHPLAAIAAVEVRAFAA